MSKINNIDYLQIIKDSWLLCWKYKFLWSLGFLVFIGTISNNLTFNRESRSGDLRLQMIFDYINDHQVIYLAIAILSLLVFAISLIAQAGLIKSVNDINLYKQLGLGKTLKAGRIYFWNTLAINILAMISALLIIMLLAVPSMMLLSYKAYVLAFIISTLALFIFISLGLLIFFIRKYSIFYLVLAECNFKDAIKKAYTLFIVNSRASILMLLLTLGLYILLAVSILISAAISVLFFAAIAYLAKIAISTFAMVTVSILASFIIIIIIGLLFAFFTAFKEAIWVIFFKIISTTDLKEKTASETKEEIVAIPNPEAV